MKHWRRLLSWMATRKRRGSWTRDLRCFHVGLHDVIQWASNGGRKSPRRLMSEMAIDIRPYGRLPVLAIWCFWGTCFYSFLTYQMYGERGRRNRVSEYFRAAILRMNQRSPCNFDKINWERFQDIPSLSCILLSSLKEGDVENNTLT